MTRCDGCGCVNLSLLEYLFSFSQIYLSKQIACLIVIQLKSQLSIDVFCPGAVLLGEKCIISEERAGGGNQEQACSVIPGQFITVSASNVSIVKQEDLMVAAFLIFESINKKKLLYLIALALEAVWPCSGFFPLSCVNIN